MSEAQDVTLEVFVRSLAPTSGQERQRAVLAHLDRLDSEGLIDGYDVHVWGDAVAADSAASDTAAGRGVRTRVAAFQQWALSENVSVQPFFETSTQSSAMTGEERTVISLPELTVAEYEGGELNGMAPHRADGDVVSVRDYVEEMELRLDGSHAETTTAESGLTVLSGD